MLANHSIYGGDWLSCDPLPTPYKETLVPHLVATLIYLSQIYSYYIRGDRSPLTIGEQTRYKKITLFSWKCVMMKKQF